MKSSKKSVQELNVNDIIPNYDWMDNEGLFEMIGVPYDQAENWMGLVLSKFVKIDWI